MPRKHQNEDLTVPERDKLHYIYKRYSPIMKYTAALMLKNKQDADDAVQNALITIANNLKLIDTSDDSKIRNFCITVVRNRAIDIARLKSNDYESLENYNLVKLLASTENIENTVEADEGYSKIIDAILSLNDTYREVCFLKFVNELADREIADMLGITLTAVKARIHRGRTILKEILRKEGYRD